MNNLEDVKKFIAKVGWGTLATTDGRTVAVRPMGGLAWNGRQLWCATSAETDKVAQLKRVPYAEYCFAEPGGRHVRIAGPCTISSDPAEKQWLASAVPDIKDHLFDPAARDYVIIKMTPEKIRVMKSNFLYQPIAMK